MLARGALGNPWLFEQVLGTRGGRAGRRGGRARMAVGARPRRGAPGRGAGGGLPAASSTPGTSPGSARARRSQDALQRAAPVSEQRAVSGRLPRCYPRRPPEAPRPAASAGLLLFPTRPGRPCRRTSSSPLKGSRSSSRRSSTSRRQAPRGCRAHQGGPGVRRHLRELRVRRRQERADDARGAHRHARGEAALGDRHRRSPSSTPNIVRVGVTVDVKDDGPARRTRS